MPSNLTVLGIAPRMHVLGETMQLDLLRGTERTCAASFDHWDFYRQRLFVYEKPLSSGGSMAASRISSRAMRCPRSVEASRTSYAVIERTAHEANCRSQVRSNLQEPLDAFVSTYDGAPDRGA
jgi:hypothetical protein